MRSDRSRMTVRVVPLSSADAGVARVGGTAEQRLALLAELNRRMWGLTQRPLPSYTRSTMPARLSTLSEQ